MHVDIKKLGPLRQRRQAGDWLDTVAPSRGYRGWESVHVMVDDFSRLAYAEVLPDGSAQSAAAFLRRGLAWFARLGVQVERVMTDNGSAYVSTRHAMACRELGLRHLRTRPYRPANQRQGLCLRFGVPSGWAARLPAPGGLTQAKGMSE